MEKILRGKVIQSCFYSREGFYLESTGDIDLFANFDGQEVEITIKTIEKQEANNDP